MKRLSLKNERPDDSLRILLTKEEKKQIKYLALEKGLSLTELVKYAINKIIEEE